MTGNHQSARPISRLQERTPSEIVRELDHYVIGQEAAKRAVAIALRNRHRRRLAPEEIREEILPNNILMIGPTGVGKTEIARRLARLAGAPFLKVEASKFTEVGYVGRDVESMVRDLVEISVSLVRGEMAEKVLTRARKHVEERLLNLLVPRHRRRGADDPEASREWETRREATRQSLRQGALNRTAIEIDVMGGRPPGGDLLAQLGMDEGEQGWAEALEQIFPQKKKRRRVTVDEAQRILLQEETGRMVDRDEVIRLALERVQSSGILFIDEIDKICSGERGHHGPDVSREGVQRDLLPIIEGSAVPTKHGLVRTDHILFIAAGAFHTARPADLIPELQGRLPIRVELRDLAAADFLRILKEPRNSLVRQYEALLAADGVELRFTPEALEKVADIAHTVNQETENIGARRLQTVLNTLLEEILFSVPELDVREVEVDAEMVERRLGGIARDKDLSRYIL
jgi:ATP-dependent HslUV protease ATP-binding subunit HslU